jgi:hypothetical protein
MTTRTFDHSGGDRLAFFDRLTVAEVILLYK